jgi:VCBS repeat protein
VRADRFEFCDCAVAIPTCNRGFSIGQLRGQLPLDTVIAPGQPAGIDRGSPGWAARRLLRSLLISITMAGWIWRSRRRMFGLPFGVVTLLRNDRQGGFGPAEFSTTPAGSVTAADVDGNGTLDVISAVAVRSRVYVALNDGTGHFTDSGKAFTVGYEPERVAAIDLNGDGLPEVITPNVTGNSITVLINQTGSTD